MISPRTCAAELLTATVTSLWVGGLVSIGVLLAVRCLSIGRPNALPALGDWLLHDGVRSADQIV